MKPIDYRNATFDEVKGFITGQREAVHQAWLTHGPCTTAELAQKSSISVLNIRPRTTELVELGFVALVPGPSHTEGTYRACTPAEAAAHFRRHQVDAINRQVELPLS